jgi:uncharacterized protein (TIGR02996 family)
MTPHDAFLEAICESPDDDTPRLMYADWLEERRRSTQNAVSSSAPSTNWPGCCRARRRPARWRAAFVRSWRRTAGVASGPADLDGIVWADEFSNGFVETVTAESVDVFLWHAPTVFAAAPVRRLNVRRATAADVAALAGSRHLSRLHARSARQPDWRRRRARRRPNRSRRCVNCSFTTANWATPECERCCGCDTPNGCELFLGGNALTDAAAEVIADAGLTSLVELDRAIMRSATPACGRWLRLPTWRTGDAATREQLRWRWWAQELADSPHLGRLRELFLRHNRVGSTGAEALARSPHLMQLGVLDLGNNRIGNAGALALAASEGLKQIYELTLTGNHFNGKAQDALDRRFGVRLRLRVTADRR